VYPETVVFSEVARTCDRWFSVAQYDAVLRAFMAWRAMLHYLLSKSKPINPIRNAPQVSLMRAEAPVSRISSAKR
jgi:hypothetical protein